MINTIIIVVARNIAMFLPRQVDEYSEEKALDILQYIQTISTNLIKSRPKLSAGILAFRQITQVDILNYKLKLVEDRLLHNEMRISEIVTELRH